LFQLQVVKIIGEFVEVFIPVCYDLRQEEKMTKSERVAIKGSKASTVNGSEKTGAPDPDEIIEVEIHLRYHPESKGLPKIEELMAHLPHKRKHLTHEEFETLHGASSEDIAKVTAFAQKHHLAVEEVNAAHRLVTVSGTIKTLSSVFGVLFHNHKHPKPGTIFRTYEGTVKIPKDLAGIVNGVFGLENAPVFKPFLAYRQDKTKAHTDDSAIKGYFPNCIADFYNFPKKLTGKGQSIAIIECGGGFDRKYLQEYFNKLEKRFDIHVNIENIIAVLVAGVENKPCTDTGDLTNYAATMETYADIEVAAAVANEAKIVVYFTPNSHKGVLKALKQAIHDKEHDNSVISFSWGWPEPVKKRGQPQPLLKIINNTLHEAAAKGITVCIAAGDGGSCDCIQPQDDLAHVDFPASSSWSLACGGTGLIIQNNKIQKETVWKHHYDEYKIGTYKMENVTFSTGGGVSEYFKYPLYQLKAGVRPKSVNPGNKTGRGMPDIAGSADQNCGYIIQTGEEMTILGGTSLVAPLYAALVAKINRQLSARLGFLNPFLYKIGKAQTKSKDQKKQDNVFNDITEGDNSIYNIDGYYARKGWDACTGWGSINGENLLKALQNHKKL
jgi:kumamolisin